MTANRIFSRSFWVGMRLWRVAGIVYFFQLALAATIGLQVFGVFESSIGQSLEFEKLLKNYDHTVFTDFLKTHGASITPLLGQLRWLLVAYLGFSVFLNAGLLAAAARPEKAGWQSFWSAGAALFFPFLKIAVLFLALAAVWSAAILGPALAFLEPSLEAFPTEAYSVWGLLAVLVFWLLGLAGLFAWSVAARFQKMEKGASIQNCLASGFKMVWKRRGRVAVLLAFFAALHGGLLGLYFLLDRWAGMTSAGWILGFFIVQQAVAFFKIQVRAMTFAGLEAAFSDAE